MQIIAKHSSSFSNDRTWVKGNQNRLRAFVYTALSVLIESKGL